MALTSEKRSSEELARDEKFPSSNQEHLENVKTKEQVFVYNDTDHEPELHIRTYVAIASMFFFNMACTFAVLSPPAVLSYIGADLREPASQTWIPNSLSLVQAVLSPTFASIADIYQIRKSLMLCSLAVAFVGAAIAPGSGGIGRLIGAQIMIGIGESSLALGYAIPSEVLPRKWRPIGQATVTVAAALGAIAGPMIIGALTKGSPADGWRTFYWIQTGLWGAAAAGILVGYRPPKRQSRLDHLSFWQKLGHLDFPGIFLLTTGLTLFLVGLNLGGGLYVWTNVRVLVTLILGIAILISFGLYEWKGTKTGILHHDMFRGGAGAGRTFALCIALIFVEGILLFAFVIFYPILTTTLYETNPFLSVARQMPFWVCAMLSTGVWGFFSTRYRTIREPLCIGFLIYTGGVIGLTTLQPSSSTNAVVFSGLAGIGFAALVTLLVTGLQLSTPHHLIITATALFVSSRAIAAAVFTAIYAAAFQTRFKDKLPAYIIKAVAPAGLPLKSIPDFIEALAGADTAALSKIPGVDPAIIAAGITALKQAFADSVRVVFIIAAPFGAVACIACLFLGDLKSTMNYEVDAPLEDLAAKNHEKRIEHGASVYPI